MRIVYLYNPQGKLNSDDTEGHIRAGLEELGHEVIMLPEEYAFDALKIPGDMLLFHKGGRFIHSLLPRIKYTRVCRYFDKIWHSRVEWAERMLPLVDKMILTDGDWARAHPSPKVKVLYQGCGQMRTGKYRPEYATNIAFTGAIYEGREEWRDFMREVFGDDFRVFGDVFHGDLYDLCQSARVLVAPEAPSTDSYWSSRIYLTLGAGGFLIHPRCKGLDAEYTDGEHYVAYSSREELVEKVDYYLGHAEERERIRRAGMAWTHQHFTCKQRVKTMMQYVQGN